MPLKASQIMSSASTFLFHVFIPTPAGVTGIFRYFVAFDEGDRILILPWAQAGCQIDLRDFRPGDRLAASTSCATVSDMVTKLCFSMSRTLQFLHRIQFLSARRTAYNRQTNQYMGLINKVDMVCLSPVGYGV